MSSGQKIPLEIALEYGNRFMDKIKPHILKGEIAGSIRRQCKAVGDIEIVCVENKENPLSNLFVPGYPGMVKNGERMKSFKYPNKGLSFELYIAQPHDYGRILAIRTGSSFFSHHQLATAWNRRGFCGTVDGLRKKSECDHKGKIWKIKPEYKDNPTLPPVFETEIDFFNFLQIEWVLPIDRNWVSDKKELNYSL